ncbi:hypothetical protein J27TS7_28670 [Paenibacillus dendritiformis]|uniref:hypothetical protein n=1 Tax=Paenibacillus dendritiformis TaxID=130049 RepID=UPI001B083FFA|nr:hypothetical protein [Paenibacillus dendritiformis]GIO73353.1 hypothetical protein J27TS7_28670 [Paenibacillus dendritiformis]
MERRNLKWLLEEYRRGNKAVINGIVSEHDRVIRFGLEDVQQALQAIRRQFAAMERDEIDIRFMEYLLLFLEKQSRRPAASEEGQPEQFQCWMEAQFRKHEPSLRQERDLALILAEYQAGSRESALKRIFAQTVIHQKQGVQVRLDIKHSVVRSMYHSIQRKYINYFGADEIKGYFVECVIEFLQNDRNLLFTESQLRARLYHHVKYSLERFTEKSFGKILPGNEQEPDRRERSFEDGAAAGKGKDMEDKAYSPYDTHAFARFQQIRGESSFAKFLREIEIEALLTEKQLRVYPYILIKNNIEYKPAAADRGRSFERQDKLPYKQIAAELQSVYQWRISEAMVRKYELAIKETIRKAYLKWKEYRFVKRVPLPQKINEYMIVYHSIGEETKAYPLLFQIFVNWLKDNLDDDDEEIDFFKRDYSFDDSPYEWVVENWLNQRYGSLNRLLQQKLATYWEQVAEIVHHDAPLSILTAQQKKRIMERVGTIFRQYLKENQHHVNQLIKYSCLYKKDAQKTGKTGSNSDTSYSTGDHRRTLA